MVYYRIFGLITILCLGGCIHCDPWSKADKWREVAYLSVHTVDWLQTRGADWERFYETNPILGNAPGRGRTDIYFITTGLLHVAVTHIIPADWRPWWQYISLGFETGVVANNYRIGMRINF